MDRAHTKGPWRATRDCFGDFTIQPHDEELAIAAVVNGEMRRMGGLSDQHEANAHLIAAAPDMYEALLQARDWLEGWATAEPQLAIIEAALSKAEGLGQRADATQNPDLFAADRRSER